MKRKIVLILGAVLLLTGCGNKVESSSTLDDSVSTESATTDTTQSSDNEHQTVNAENQLERFIYAYDVDYVPMNECLVSVDTLFTNPEDEFDIDYYHFQKDNLPLKFDEGDYVYVSGFGDDFFGFVEDGEYPDTICKVYIGDDTSFNARSYAEEDLKNVFGISDIVETPLSIQDLSEQFDIGHSFEYTKELYCLSGVSEKFNDTFGRPVEASIIFAYLESTDEEEEGACWAFATVNGNQSLDLQLAPVIEAFDNIQFDELNKAKYPENWVYFSPSGEYEVRSIDYSDYPEVELNEFVTVVAPSDFKTAQACSSVGDICLRNPLIGELQLSSVIASRDEIAYVVLPYSSLETCTLDSFGIYSSITNTYLEELEKDLDGVFYKAGNDDMACSSTFFVGTDDMWDYAYVYISDSIPLQICFTPISAEYADLEYFKGLVDEIVNASPFVRVED